MIYEIFRLIGVITGYPMQLLFFKRKTYYEDAAQKPSFKGGKLIIMNHFNILDYVMSCFIVFPRKLYAVTSEMPFKFRIVRFGMKFFGTIQCNRETRNMGFMNEAAVLLRKDQLVQIFPEGRNTPDGKMHDFKRSYLVIAHRAKAPIIPIVTDGQYGLFKRAHVMIGKEIDVSPFFTTDRPMPPREEIERANAYVYGKMLELQAELERRKQGGTL
ncbi:MAG: 1-acyl-sn-glycerol-3-phosphate acyltransferase [Clostridia bacterium]|jgi:1-acyl-sn-glycerol-3-phosphate acyltransferase|nr:1-acyl-sn-glycerol-3-phosphate acyltransferase [Clostridia bacterium]